MNAAIYSTLIGVLGGGLLGLLTFQFRTITGGLNRISDQLTDQGERLASVEATAQNNGERLARIEATAQNNGERLARIEATVRDQGERLARIENKLDNNPPAEAA